MFYKKRDVSGHEVVTLVVLYFRYPVHYRDWTTFDFELRKTGYKIEFYLLVTRLNVFTIIRVSFIFRLIVWGPIQ